ncbi:hypothetical protein [Aquimarina algicola]|uniref:CdiI immunity protein domain-containing protein n=1 Tax=Aquimarina algicola TaxID=2589995 RepID=A0A504IZD2_9FLAO|nr:hypothetical protein [Aquimarina algicola]TPN83896.1 hypothetical protein FHK87_18190 [Aquimarina algicola]
MLEIQYPNAFQFLTGYFPEADLEYKSDEDVVTIFIDENASNIITDTKEELQKLTNDETMWQEAANEANRHFQDTQEIETWLKTIFSYFPENL